MKPRFSPLTLLATALVAGSASLSFADDGLPGRIVPDGFGVNIHFTDPQPGEMERFAEGGFKFVRMDFAWQAVERERGKYDFSAYDRLVDHLDKVGARAYFILDYGNRLYDDGLSPHTPAGRAAFAAFAKAAAGHFQGRGVVWEVWNEPNIDFWKPRPNVEDYTKLAVETVKAVREADPKAVILLPATSGFPWDFFETLFASGVLADVDGVSVHPYRESHPETAADDYGRLRALIARHAPPEKRMMPIVSGEWGYSTAEGRFTEAEQARYIVREYLANLASGVNLSIFYDWKDDGPDPKENEHRFGTVRQDLTPKPSFLAAKALIRDLKGYTFRHRLAGESPAEWKLLFRDYDGFRPPAVVSWTTDATAPESARTPRVRQARDSDPDAADLKILAAIETPVGPVAEDRDHPFQLSIQLAGLDAGAFTVRIAGAAEPLKPLMVIVDGEISFISYKASPSPYRTPHRDIALEMTYKGRKLPAIAPLQVWRSDPLSLAFAPRGGACRATIDNPSRRPFHGRLTARGPDGKETATVAVDIPEGKAKGDVSLKVESPTIVAALVDADGAAVLEPISGRFEPIAGPEGGDVLDGLEADLHVENAGTGGKPLESSIDHGERVLRISYDFDAGWRYLVVRPREPLPIPEKAREALIWLKGDGSGAYVRCRFGDAAGQTFQPDLGRLDFDGWKLIRIPLDGSAPGARWGGSGVGPPRPPLRWEALLLLDSPHREQGGRGSAVMTSPSYRFDP
jgi:hypothetical protein